MDNFSTQVLSWFAINGRKDLPWQQQPSAYRVWVSEIMLQQTQVATVIPYYERFMQAFPDIHSLAAADIDQVLHQWTGLGYYARARNMHRTANTVVEDFDGNFPDTVELLCALPGIGRSTAGAIAALAFKQPAAILDGNVKRVLTRYYGIAGWPEQSRVKKQLWQLAESLTPTAKVDQYTQAMMDLGATVCTRTKPGCSKCPLHTDCIACQTESVPLYPGRKAGKALPIKQVAMYMLQNEQHQVLLEKRPPTGIWGGLWSFPETGCATDKPTSIGNGLCFQSTSNWPLIKHTFSHFQLEITPVHGRVEDRNRAVMDSDRWLWYPLNNPLEVGVAAPVKKLLTQLTRLSR